MRISHRHRFIFFSFPKTASSTLRHFIDPFSDVRPVRRYADVSEDNPFHPHMRPEEAREWFERFGWEFARYTRFTCIRNPWARLVSLYHHIGRSESPPPFGDWIRSLTADDAAEERLWLRYGRWPFERFIRDRDGNVLVDKVLRTEDIDETLIPYLRRIGVPIAGGRVLPRRNHSGAGSGYRTFYDPRTAALVRELFAYEVEHFGYSFGDDA
ncbi:MAG: sulfotransferase family protein [Holophagales bacterium]|nr:sulfotransferase family protein [Holophagales bacterium]